jgi:hypothetical protein
MPRSNFITTKLRRPTVVAVGVILTATLTLGSFSGPASAEWHDRDRRDHHRRDWDRRDWDRRDWDRGYYRAPPVVYGTPYYAPPLVYGPGGLNVYIR